MSNENKSFWGASLTVSEANPKADKKLNAKQNIYFSRGLRKKGFTMIEILVVVVIIGIITAIAIPSVAAFMQQGQQTGRDNMARTIFLAAQNQLAEMRLTKNLNAYVAQGVTDGTIKNVEDTAGNSVNWDEGMDVGSKEDIMYITKDRDNPDSDINLDNTFSKLLDGDVVDDDVLKDAICIEFNKASGAVLSVFYSDAVPVGQSLKYNKNGSKTDISGDRPYSTAKERRQGYYGGEGTFAGGAEQDQERITLHQGEKEPLKDSGGTYKDLLYAEILMPKDASEGKYLLEVRDKDRKKIKELASLEPILKYEKNAPPTTLRDIIKRINSETDSVNYDGYIIYKAFNSDPETQGKYDRYIWVLDLLAEDSYNYNPYSIGGKFGVPGLVPQEIQASITEKNVLSNIAYTPKSVHSHYDVERTSKVGTKLVSYYDVNESRHLYNVRYKPDGNFYQTKDINLNSTKASDSDRVKVENFLPIPYMYDAEGILKRAGKSPSSFSGKYTSIDIKEIENLVIKNANSEIQHIGLFGFIGGNLNNALVQGISLKNATINSKLDNDESPGSNNVGSIAGAIGRGAIMRCSSFSNVSAEGNIDKINIGGIAGAVVSDDPARPGIISQSYNGGFYKAKDDSLAEKTDFGSVSVSGNVLTSAEIGGIAGRNEGTIENSYNNARVQIDSVNVDSTGMSQLKSGISSYYSLIIPENAAAYIGGIAGSVDGNGIVKNTYSTNFVGKALSPKGDDIAANCITGGIVGKFYKGASKVRQSYYLPNGEKSVSGDDIKEKNVLSAEVPPELGKHFNGGTIYKGPYDDTTSGAYTYPTLKNNPHKTPWEDIYYSNETNLGKIDNIKYYEIYKDGSYGLWSPNDQNLNNSKEVIRDGYIYIPDEQHDNNGVKIQIYDKKDGNLIEEKASLPKSTTSPLLPGITFVDLGTLELEDISLGLNALYIVIGQGNADKGDYFEGYVNPLYAKAIYEERPNQDGTDPSKKGVTYIRSPRHLDNINFVRSTNSELYRSPKYGNFRQDANINYVGLNTDSGYKKINKLAEPDTGEVIKIEEAAVRGVFNGIYSGYSSGKVNSLSGFQNNPAQDSELASGLFSVNQGEIKGLALENFNVTSRKMSVGTGVLAGVNKGVIGAAQLNNSIKISNCSVVGEGSALGGLVGINESKGLITNVSAESGSISSDYAWTTNYGGLVGINSGTVGNTNSLTVVNNVKIDGGGSNAGGLVGFNTTTGSIVNVSISGGAVKRPNDSYWSINYGGLAGLNNGKIGDARIDGGVTVTNIQIENRGSNTGGIVGYNTGTLLNASSIDTNISGAIDWGENYGGIAGMNTGQIGASGSAIFVIDGSIRNKGHRTGGLIGANTKGAIVMNATVSGGAVINDVGDGTRTGGLVGENAGQIGTTESAVIVLNSSISNDGDRVGGLAGTNVAGAIIRNAVVSGSAVTNDKKNGAMVGGLVGENAGAIGEVGIGAAEIKVNTGIAVINSTVTGKESSDVGGLIGVNLKGGEVNKAMVVDTEVSGGEDVGGLVGDNSADVKNVFFSHTSSGAAIRSPQTENFTCPITNNPSDRVHKFGGLIGKMSGGELSNAYMAAFIDKLTGNPIVGESTGSTNVVRDAYYLSSKDKVFNGFEENAVGIPISSSGLKAKNGKPPFLPENGWKNRAFSPGQVARYPYPVFLNMEEPTTWCWPE